MSGTRVISYNIQDEQKQSRISIFYIQDSGLLRPQAQHRIRPEEQPSDHPGVNVIKLFFFVADDEAH